MCGNMQGATLKNITMFFAFQVPVFQNSPLTNTNNYNLQIIDAVPNLKCHGELSDRCIILFINTSTTLTSITGGLY
jgi:hypothetical protein